MDAIAAKALLQRYLEGNASQEELITIEQWYLQLVDAGEWNWAEGEREQLEAIMEARLLGQIGKEPVETVMPGDRGAVRRIGVVRRKMVR